MKKLLSIKYSAGAFNFALLILRIVFGFLLMRHGYDKLIKFGPEHNSFLNFHGIGSTPSFALVIFAEFFCGFFVAIGLFTRLACIPIIISMVVALWMVHHFAIFDEGQAATLFLTAFITILFVGPGRISVDGIING